MMVNGREWVNWKLYWNNYKWPWAKSLHFSNLRLEYCRVQRPPPTESIGSGNDGITYEDNDGINYEDNDVIIIHFSICFCFVLWQ